MFEALPERLGSMNGPLPGPGGGGGALEEVAAKIALDLDGFRSFFLKTYGHERISTVSRRAGSPGSGTR